MRRTLPVRLLTCAILAGSASLSAIVVSGSTAGSVTTPETVTCTHLTGSETAQSISGCSGTGLAQTGISGSSVVSTATITWKTKLTSKEKYKTSVDTGSKNTCANKAGYTKEDLVIETGSITGGTATKLVGGKTSADVCLYKKGSVFSVVNKGSVKF
jgi:hypothetical protein